MIGYKYNYVLLTLLFLAAISVITSKILCHIPTCDWHVELVLMYAELEPVSQFV